MSKENSPLNETVSAHLHLLATMAFFGSAFAGSKMVVDEVSHQVAAALRFGGGALILVFLTIFVRKMMHSDKLTFGKMVRAAAIGLLGVFAYNLFFFWGLSLAPSVDGSIIVPALSPVK